MKRSVFWGTNLEIMAFFDMMRLNISIYTLRDQIFSQAKISHPNNTGVINFSFKKLKTLWRTTKILRGWCKIQHNERSQKL